MKKKKKMFLITIIFTKRFGHLSVVKSIFPNGPLRKTVQNLVLATSEVVYCLSVWRQTHTYTKGDVCDRL